MKNLPCTARVAGGRKEKGTMAKQTTEEGAMARQTILFFKSFRRRHLLRYLDSPDATCMSTLYAPAWQLALSSTCDVYVRLEVCDYGCIAYVCLSRMMIRHGHWVCWIGCVWVKKMVRLKTHASNTLCFIT